MSTVFTMIIEGTLPGRFVWRDERCVAFLSINPLRHGHTLVVPIEETDHWVDLDLKTSAHLMTVAHHISRAQVSAFQPTRVGLMIAGFEVPHTHLHVIPIDTMEDLDFANAATDPDPVSLDQAAELIRTALKSAGHPEATDE